MCIAHLHLSVAPLSFEPLHFNSHAHLAVSPLVSLIYTSPFHLLCAALTCTSPSRLSHVKLWHSPLMCTSQFHLWYATLTSALSFTSPWNLSFAIVDYNCHLDLSFEPLGCSPSSHIGVALAICISRFQPQVQLSWAAFVHTSQLQLSLEPLVQLPCVPCSFTAQLNLSFVPFALTCQ